jgi:hypothetical protein
MRQCSRNLSALFIIYILLFAPASARAAQEKEMCVAQGEVSVLVSLELPEGYAVSDDAPSSVKVTSSNVKAVNFDGKPATIITNPSFPVKLKARTTGGKADLAVEFSVYYCGHKDSSVCKAYRKTITVPVTVAKGSGTKNMKIHQKVTL